MTRDNFRMQFAGAKENAQSVLSMQNQRLFSLPAMLAALLAVSARADDSNVAPWLEVDHQSLVSQADLVYDSPARRPVEGQPIGNGRMGTLVWTSPGAVHFQINRNDVFAVNRNHAGPQFGPTDYCGGCASVVLAVGGEPFASGEAFSQRLSLYDAEVHVSGAAVKVRCFVASHTDVLVLEIDDQRAKPQAVRLAVSMWRAPDVVTQDHSARYRFSESNGRLTLSQMFAEKDHLCASAVTVGIGNAAAEIQSTGARSRSVVVPARRGKRTFFVASAASLGGEGGLGGTGLQAVHNAKRAGPETRPTRRPHFSRLSKSAPMTGCAASICRGGTSSGRGPSCV